jgi:hypothetical protein
MMRYTKSEARRLTKRLLKTGELEPRKHSLSHLSDNELLDKLQDATEKKDNRKVQRITLELVRRARVDVQVKQLTGEQ